MGETGLANSSALGTRSDWRTLRASRISCASVHPNESLDEDVRNDSAHLSP
jgi:hypothetical protein